MCLNQPEILYDKLNLWQSLVLNVPLNLIEWVISSNLRCKGGKHALHHCNWQHASGQHSVVTLAAYSNYDTLLTPCCRERMHGVGDGR